ncbi:MAG: ankyrin repeat domain-containing protein [Phycisphaeraceae bacterium]|nr:ankyrin repeat domain-containing protein [Phycisphaeraceae bacterium]MBX3366985.1 ankyrin repeat domain-containing protein [Phycisphaeraceae bacterium]
MADPLGSSPIDLWPDLSEDEWLARLEAEPELVSAIDSSGNSLLYEAAAMGYARLAETLLARGSDPNVYGGDGYWPLRIAAESNDLEMVHILLKWKAHPTHPALAPAFSGAKRHILFSALYTAILHAITPVVRALVEAGADVNHEDLDQDTPLHHAVRNNRPDVVRLLIERGADVNSEAYGGVKPADVADNEAAALVRKHQNLRNKFKR